jgi:hypothetical protein
LFSDISSASPDNTKHKGEKVMSDSTDTISDARLPWKRDENGKIVPEPIDWEAVKNIPGDDAQKLNLARLNVILRAFEQGTLPAHTVDAAREVKIRADSYYAGDPNTHFLEHAWKAHLAMVEERKSQERDWQRKWREREERRVASSKQAREPNKQVLFDALAGLGVHTIIVEFNGYGDSGQIEGICATDASEREVRLPDTPTITILTVEHESVKVRGCHSTSACEVCELGGLHQNVYTVNEAIEAVCNGWLEETHEGWEINDGAYGTFEFDVAERTVTLEYCERYTETKDYTHEF